jgi:hypothetical protein
MVEQNTSVWRFDHQVITDQLLIRKHLARIRLLQAQICILIFIIQWITVFLPVFQKDAGNVVRERFPVREDERHCFYLSFDNGAADQEKPPHLDGVHLSVFDGGFPLPETVRRLWA